jgi:hypothetical protein
MAAKLDADPAMRERGEAIARKAVVDDNLRAVRIRIAEICAGGRTGTYVHPSVLAELRREEASTLQESIAIQGRLGTLKRAAKDRNIERANQMDRAFRKAAYEFLDEDEFREVEDIANELLEEWARKA